MSDPNLPEGCKQSDIDATVGETFDPNLCEHDLVKCENCETNLNEVVRDMKLAGIGHHKLKTEFMESVDDGFKLVQQIHKLEAELSQSRASAIELLNELNEVTYQLEWLTKALRDQMLGKNPDALNMWNSEKTVQVIKSANKVINKAEGY